MRDMRNTFSIAVLNSLCVCVCRTLFTAAIAAVMSTCDSVKTVLSGAVFTLINASAVLRTGQNGKMQEVLSTAVQIK